MFFFLYNYEISFCNKMVPMKTKLLLNHIVIQVCLLFPPIYHFILIVFLLGLFIARSKNSDMLVTRNMVVGESVYDEKLISVDV
jgi:hypothetical protein